MLTAKKNPALRVSNGKISLGISHPNGPHDHANPDTNTQIKMSTTMAECFGITFVAFKCFARVAPITDYKKQIHKSELVI